MGSIKWKLALLYMILVVFVVIVSGVYIILNVQNSAYESTYTELEYTSDRIIDTLETAHFDEETDVQSVFAEILSALLMESINLDTKDIYLLDADGNLLYYRDADLTDADLKSKAITEAMEGTSSESLYVHRVYDGEENVSVGDYAAFFQINEDDAGYIVFIRESMTEVENTVYNTMMIILTASIIAILLAGLLAFFLAGTIVSPLRRLTRRTQEMAEGNLEAADTAEIAKRGSRDEITELESNFAYMGRALSSMLREVNHEKNKLSTIFAYMADGLAVYDTEGKLVQSNPAAKAWMGDRILYQDFQTVFSPDTVEEILKTPEESHTRLMQVEETYINAIYVPYREDDGQIAGLIVVLQDTTEQKKMEQMQQEFVANVSHELRTPITTIKSYVETLMDGAKDDPEIEEQFLSVIDHEADRMTYLISELLELSRIDSRQVKLKMEPVDMAELIETCVFEHQVNAEKKEQQITVDPLPKRYASYYVLGDEERIEQVLHNLISNAIKYSPEKASIHLGLRKGTGRIEVYVKDNGPGIEKKEQERIFERFYRVDKARSRSMGGTGLGLSISREIMEMHHGLIWVESEYGIGSTFWLSFPLMSDADVKAYRKGHTR